MVGKVLDACIDEPQTIRDWIGAKYTELCLHEIFVWRFMQVFFLKFFYRFYVHICVTFIFFKVLIQIFAFY